MGGERRAIRAEQLRAGGLSEQTIARTLEVPLDAVRRWFELQDQLVLVSADESYG